MMYYRINLAKKFLISRLYVVRLRDDTDEFFPQNFQLRNLVCFNNTFNRKYDVGFRDLIFMFPDKLY